MSDKCPFCKEPFTYSGCNGQKRSPSCYEAELARKDELLQKAGGLFNKWLYLEKNGLLSCCSKTLARETNAFLNMMEIKP